MRKKTFVSNFRPLTIEVDPIFKLSNYDEDRYVFYNHAMYCRTEQPPAQTIYDRYDKAKRCGK